MTSIVFRDETVTSASQWHYYNNSGTLITNQSEGYTQARYLESLSRGETPNYRQLVRLGKLRPMQTYTRVSLNCSYVSGSYRTDRDSDNSYGVYVGGAKPALNPPNWLLGTSLLDTLDIIDPDEITYTVQKAAAKFYTDGFDALTFLAELRQTIVMFTKLVPRIIKLIKRTKPEDFGKALADVDLEVRYGWRTLYYDLQELCDLTKGKTRGKMFRGFAQTTTDPFPNQPPNEVVWSSGLWTCSYSDTINVRYNGRVYGSSRPPKFVINPILTAWEVIRLSFVIDWFISIGQWLAALQFATIHSDHVSGGGYHVYWVRQTNCTAGPRNGHTPTGHANFISILDVKTRSPVAISKLPQWKVRLDSWKIVDLLALILQALRAKRR